MILIICQKIKTHDLWPSVRRVGSICVVIWSLFGMVISGIAQEPASFESRIEWADRFVSAEKQNALDARVGEFYVNRIEKFRVRVAILEEGKKIFSGGPIEQGTISAVQLSTLFGTHHPSQGSPGGHISMKTRNSRDGVPISTFYYDGFGISFEDRPDWYVYVNSETVTADLAAARSKFSEMRRSASELAFEEEDKIYGLAESYLEACRGAITDAEKAPKIPAIVQSVVAKVVQARWKLQGYSGPYTIPEWAELPKIEFETDLSRELSKSLADYIVTKGNAGTLALNPGDEIDVWKIKMTIPEACEVSAFGDRLTIKGISDLLTLIPKGTSKITLGDSAFVGGVSIFVHSSGKWSFSPASTVDASR